MRHGFPVHASLVAVLTAGALAALPVAHAADPVAEAPSAPPAQAPDVEPEDVPDSASAPESDAQSEDASPVPEPDASEPVASEADAPEADPDASEDDPFADDPLEDDPFADDPFDDEASAADYDPRVDSPEAIEARRFVRGGIVMTSVGAVLVVGSIALGLSDPCARPAGNSCSAPSRNRAALTMGIPGAIILASGLALVSVGVKKRRRVQATFTAGREGAGVVLFGRF
jgi:hypothetical protein